MSPMRNGGTGQRSVSGMPSIDAQAHLAPDSSASLAGASTGRADQCRTKTNRVLQGSGCGSATRQHEAREAHETQRLSPELELGWILQWYRPMQQLVLREHPKVFLSPPL